MASRPTSVPMTANEQRDALGQTAGRILVEASIAMKTRSGEGYTYEQGRYDAAKEILDSLDGDA